MNTHAQQGSAQGATSTNTHQNTWIFEKAQPLTFSKDSEYQRFFFSILEKCLTFLLRQHALHFHLSLQAIRKTQS